MAAIDPAESMSRRMSWVNAYAGLPRKVLALMDVAMSEMPTASQGMEPPPNMKSLRFLLRLEKWMPIHAMATKYRAMTSQSMSENIPMPAFSERSG
jgi:hypothetical protein